jgi:hypothetical protein
MLFHPKLTQPPTPFEQWILKWVIRIFAVLSGLALLWALVSNTQDRWACKKICQTQGFYDYQHTRQPKGARHGKCVCLNEAEAKQQGRVASGVIVNIP